MATIEPYQTASSGTLYAVRYRKPDNKQTWKRGFARKRDAQAFAATVEVSKMRGEYVAPSLGKVTVGVASPCRAPGGHGPPLRTYVSPRFERGSPSCPPSADR